MFNPNMSNKEVADLIFLNYKDKTPFLNLDYANVTTTNLQAERAYATGGQGAPRRVAFDYNRNGTLAVQTQITTMKLFSILSGSDVSESFKYAKRIKLTSVDGKLTLPDNITFVAGSVYVYAEDDDCGTPLEITLENKTITLPSGSVAGDFIVYGIVSVATGAKTVKFDSKTFPKAFVVYGETPWKTEDDEIVAMHLAYYKAVPQSSFELAFSNSGVIDMTITCDLLADDDNNIYDMSIVE